MPKQPPIDISLDRFADALEQAARKDIPDILGQAAVDAFKQNFQDEGFFGSGWKEVKRRQGHAKGAAASRPILTGPTGNLGRSIDYETSDHEAVGIVGDVHQAVQADGLDLDVQADAL